jgi:hypothetical protein
MKQITVLTRKETSELARVASVLAEAGVNIEEIDAERLEETGLIVLSVDKYDAALRALADHGLRAITQDVLVIRMVDKPGALAEVAKRLRDASVDVRSMHILRREGGASLVSLVVSDTPKARGLLADLVVKPETSG